MSIFFIQSSLQISCYALAFILYLLIAMSVLELHLRMEKWLNEKLNILDIEPTTEIITGCFFCVVCYIIADSKMLVEGEKSMGTSKTLR